jgi:hypothetical protein
VLICIVPQPSRQAAKTRIRPDVYSWVAGRLLELNEIYIPQVLGICQKALEEVDGRWQLRLQCLQKAGSEEDVCRSGG